MKLLHAALLALCLSLTACSTTTAPSLVDSMQTAAEIKSKAAPTHLTDAGILHFGEAILSSWGLRSYQTERLNLAGQMTLAALSTGALVASGSGASSDVTMGLVAAFNIILQALGIIKPAERNDARHEGAAMILDARGGFLEALAAKQIYRISNTRFTPAGAIYFRQINAALKIVDKLLVGLSPRIKDLEDVQPVPPPQQPDPTPEVVNAINREGAP